MKALGHGLELELQLEFGKRLEQRFRKSFKHGLELVCPLRGRSERD